MKRLGGLLALLVIASGCGSTGTVSINVKSVSSALAAARVVNPETLAVEGSFGEAPVGTSGLTSFKMYFREIKLCKNLTTSGSGYSGEEGCEAIYKNDSDPYAISHADSSFNRAAAIAAGSGKYFDVLSAADRAALTASAEIPTGEYNYGIIEAHHYVKLTAKVDRTGGTALCTPAAANSTENSNADSNGYVHVRQEAASLACNGDPGESVIWLPSSNTLFKFLKPFTVEEGESVQVDLAFNLDKEVKAVTSASEISSTDGSQGIHVPMIRMVPVPRKDGESTKVESYLLTPASSSNFKVRLELYYNSADSAKTIQSAMVTVVSTSSSFDGSSAVLYAYSAEQNGTVVALKSWDGSPSLTIDRAGTTGTLTCPKHNATQYMFADDCKADTVGVTYAAPTVYTLAN